MATENPTHVAGFTIQTPIEFGTFGRCYVGFHSQEGRRILKILRDGEEVALSDEEHAKLQADNPLLFFEPRQQTEQGQRILIGHFHQAASMGLLVSGSEIQKGCEKTTRELDPNNECAQTVRSTTLQQKLELVKVLAQRIEKMHSEKKTFPYLTPWSVMLSDAQPKLVDVGLGYSPDKLDLGQVHEDILCYFAPEVVRCLAEKKPLQVGPAADIYALGLTARSILLEKVVEMEGSPAPAPAPAGGAAAPAAPAAGLTKRESILAGRTWKKTYQEKISTRLERCLARAASSDPRRRHGSVTEFVREIDSILKSKEIAWTPPSKAPQAVFAALVVLAILIGGYFALRPSPKEYLARKAYVDATHEGDLQKRLDLLTKAPQPDSGPLVETLRLKAITLLDQAQKTPANTPQAVEAVRAYATSQKNGTNDADALTARFVAAFMQRWALMERTDSTKELTEIAGSSPSDEKAKMLPLLANCALRVAPFGVEGGDLKPEDVKRWLDASREALGEDSPLKRLWPKPSGYEKFPELQQTSYHAGWIAKALTGRLKTLLAPPDDSAVSELLEARDTFPTFATSGAYAIQLAKAAKDEKTIAEAKAALDAAQKLKRENQTFGEGTLALANLAFTTAKIAKQDQAKAFNEAKAAYKTALLDKASTPGLDLAPLANRGVLLSGKEAGIATARDERITGDAQKNRSLLNDAATALQDYLDASDKDKTLQEGSPDVHVALGLIFVALGRQEDAEPHLGWVYVDGELKKDAKYRVEGDVVNKPVSEIFYKKCRKDLEDLLGKESPDEAKHQALHEKLDALAKLEKFDLSFMPLNDAKQHLKIAEALKPGKKRKDALLAARNTFDGVFSKDETWQEGVEGRMRAALLLARDEDDPKESGAFLAEAQTFLDKAPDALKARKISQKEVAKALDPQTSAVRKEWFALLDRWLKAKGDSVDLSNENDQLFVTTILKVAEGDGKTELDQVAKGHVAQVHFVIGKWSADQKKWTEAVTHLGAAVDNLPPEKDALISQAALAAADIALLHSKDVREEEAPWKGAAGATAWGRDVLAKRLGAQNYRSFVDQVKQGKITLFKDAEAAKRLVDDILKNETSVTVDDLTFATKIYAKSAKAYLLLARGKAAQGAKPEAKDAARTAMDNSDAAREPDIFVEAAHIYCVSAPDSDVKTADFKSVVEKAQGLSSNAAGKWKENAALLPNAYAPLYWLGRHNQASADDRTGGLGGTPDDTAKKQYGAAQKNYEDYKKAVTDAGSNAVPEASDLQTRINTCAINSQ
ncbi:hypothetical protein HY251_19745 [bacterium]|nr:hypothetical protein [bacterium]